MIINFSTKIFVIALLVVGCSALPGSVQAEREAVAIVAQATPVELQIEQDGESKLEEAFRAVAALTKDEQRLLARVY